MELDTKLIAVSKCGKYAYIYDSLTGHKSFAPADYLKKVIEKRYDSSCEKFVKEYLTRETKKYLAAGYTSEQIKEIASKHKNLKLPKINVKLKKDPRIPKKTRKSRLSSSKGEQSTIIHEDGREEIVTTYPWTGNPDYFKSEVVPLNFSESSKDVCHMPGCYLTDECYGCKYYELCQFPGKYKLKK